MKLASAPYVLTPPSKPFTLVLDLDETLLHYYEVKLFMFTSLLKKSETEGELRIRPWADEFLKVMSEYFEIMIFTAAMQDYADWALEHFENIGCITHRFYRHHALPYGGFYVKDLSRIGRDISKTIIVDNIAENF